MELAFAEVEVGAKSRVNTKDPAFTKDYFSNLY